MLFVDAGNDRIGIGKSSPRSAFELGIGHIVLPASGRIGTGGSGDTPETAFRFTSADNISAIVGNNEKFRIDNSGRLLVGTSSSKNVGTSTAANLQIERAATGATLITAVNHSNGPTGASIALGKSRGTTVGSNTIVQSGDTIGDIRFAGADGTDTETRAAQISCVVDGTPGSNDMPGRLTFSTTADGASSPTERLRIDSSGDYLFLGGTLRIKDSGNTTQRGAIYADSSDFNVNAGVNNLVLFSAGSEAARFDSSGRLLVGTSSAIAPSNENFAVVSGGNTQISLARNDTSVNSGDTISQIKVYGNDSNGTYQECARIGFEADDAHATGDKPTRMVFETTADGASSPTEALKLDSQQRMYNLQAYTATTGSSANVVVLSDGRFLRSSSSSKYKTNIETLEDSYADAVLNCRPVWYQSTTEADNPEHGHWGFIAEEVAAIDPRLCFFKEEEDGRLEPEGVQYDRFVPHLLNLIKRQQSAIETLETKVAALEAQ